jgi:hypothetical protein
MRNLARLFEERGDIAEAVRWYVKNGYSEQDVARLVGDMVGPRDELEEFDRLRERADRGEIRAMMALADVSDNQERKAWLSRATDHGELHAPLFLAYEFAEEGQWEQAARWYQRTFDGGLVPRRRRPG